MVGTRSGIAIAKVGKPGLCALRAGDPLMLGQDKGKLQSYVVPLICIARHWWVDRWDWMYRHGWLS
eukprot:scaffold51301_cov39-Attheya_sp.AAC.1